MVFESRTFPRNINIETDHPAGVLESMLERFREMDLTNYYRGLSKDLEELHEFYFASETDPDGRAWEELSPRTVEKKGFSDILIHYGHLRDSLIGDHGDAIRDIIIEGEHQSLTFGTYIEYAYFLQDGTVNMPQRAMVGVSETAADRIRDQLADHVLGTLIEGSLT